MVRIIAHRFTAPSRNLIPALAVVAALLGFPFTALAFTSNWNAASGIYPDQIICPYTFFNNTGFLPQFQAGRLVISTTTSTNNTWYRHAGADLSMPADSLVVEFQVRYVSGATGNTARAPISVVIVTAPSRGTGFFIGNGEFFFTSANLTRGGTAAAPTSDAPHTYRIVITGNALRIYRDGVLRLTGSTFFDTTVFGTTVRIDWGEGSSLAFGTSEWVSFTHNAAASLECSPVPVVQETWGSLKSRY